MIYNLLCYYIFVCLYDVVFTQMLYNLKREQNVEQVVTGCELNQVYPVDSL